MVKVGELIVEFKVKDTGSKELKSIQNQVKSFGSATQIAIGNIAAQAFLTLTDYAQEAFDTYSTGIGVTEGFNALAEDQEGLLNDLQEATNNEVAALDLMKTANVGLMAEMTPDQLIDVAAASEQLAEVMGVDVTKAFNDLVTGIARGSPRILDNLGIFVMGEQAVEDYADELGVAVDEMDRVDKQTAIMNIALDKAAEIQGIVSDSTTDLGDKVNQARASFNDMTNSLGRALAPAFLGITEIVNNYVIPAVEDIMGVVEKFVNFLDSVGFFKILDSIAGFIGQGISNIVGGIGGVFDFLTPTRSMGFGGSGGGGGGMGNVPNVTQYVTVNATGTQPSPEISSIWGDAMLRSLTPSTYVSTGGFYK